MIKKLLISLVMAAGATAAFSSEAQERIILLNEGMWQANNGRVTYFEDGAVVSNEWFRETNGYEIGDTPNDIIRVNDNLIAIAVNWSNIVQFITPDGKAVAATEEVPNNRKLASDGDYVYITSYGHECLVNDNYEYFDKGYVAKIDVKTFKVVAAVEVGYEPEGIALYDGHLFVANTGGYAFNEGHDYESTISVIDAATMEVTRNVETGQINLYGKLSQSGQYICVNSPGDYYDVMAATIILDCQAVLDGKPDDECFVKLDYASTYSCKAADGSFYAVGSRYSYYTSQYEFNYITIDPKLVMESGGGEGVVEEMPGSVLDDLKGMAQPYGIYVNPYTGYIYATDAASFASGGELYQWTPEGELVSKFEVYINPAHFLALPPDDYSSIGETFVTGQPTDADNTIYNLQGQRIANPCPGQLYIKRGKKFLMR